MPGFSAKDASIRPSLRGLFACLAAAVVLVSGAASWAEKTDPGMKRQLEAAHRLQVVGRHEEARDLYRKLYEIYPESEAIVREYGETLVMTKDYGEAEALYLEIRRRDNRPLAYADRLAEIHLLQGRHQDAVGDCLDVLAASREQIDWVGGELAKISGEADGGLDMVLKAVTARAEAHPKLGEYRMLAVEMLARAARSDEAAAMLESLRGTEELGCEDLQLLGIRLDALKEKGLAIEALRLSLERQGNVGGISGSAFKLAELLAETGQAEESRKVLANLAERYPNSGAAFRAQLMAATLESDVLGRPDRALLLYEELLTEKKLPVRPEEVKEAMGKCLLRLGRLAEAREIYAVLAMAAESPNPRAHFMAAEVSFFMGETDSALSLYSALAGEHPDWELANDAIERVFLLQENAAQAGGSWISFAPGGDGAKYDPLSLFAAAELLATIDKPDSALGYLITAIDAHPDSPLVDDAMFRASDLLLELGDVERAVEYLASVAVDHPGGRLAPLAREKLGDIWWEKLGDGRRALEEYTKGLDEYPNSLVAPRVRDKVARLRAEVG